MSLSEFPVYFAFVEKGDSHAFFWTKDPEVLREGSEELKDVDVISYGEISNWKDFKGVLKRLISKEYSQDSKDF